MKILILVFLLVPVQSIAETMYVILKDGKVYSGEIIDQEFGKYVILENEEGKKFTILSDKIKKISKSNPFENREPSSVQPEPIKNRAKKTVRRDIQSLDEPEIQKSDWFITPRIGMIFGVSSNYKVYSSGDSLLSESDEDGKSTMTFGLEFANKPRNEIYSSSFLISYSRYKYDETSDPDTHIQLMGIPRLNLGGGPVKGWIGFGGGLNILSVGESSVSAGSVSINVTEMSFGYILSPRMGVDIEILPNYFLNLNFGYVYSSNSVDSTITVGSTSTKLNQTVNRSWLELSLGISLPIN